MNGNRVVRVGLVTAATTGLLVGGLAGTAAAADIHMVLKAVQTQLKETDVGPAGPSVGDRQVFSENLFKAGTKVGTDGVECVITHVTKNKNGKITAVDSQCVGTLRLGRDQISVQGLLVFNLAKPKPFYLVVTGGTGAYKGASGEMLVEQDGASETKSKLTLDIAT